jgi:hypothetical protein
VSDVLVSGAVPIVIIGAARSGTNVLRDVLTTVGGFATWPCDEINPIWRHGNRDHADDEFLPDHARPAVRRYIRGRFDRIARRTRSRVVVEKTCANALRVAFVDRVLPEARFVAIERDGYDVVASALRRWHAPLNLQYTARKARFVPATDLPAWTWRFLQLRLERMSGSNAAPPSWGPCFTGMQTALRTQSLPRVAALQWARCITRSRADLSVLAAERVHRLDYEDLVAQPHIEIARLLDWCGMHAAPDLVRCLAREVCRDGVGHGHARLGEDAVAEIAPIVAAAGATT